MPRFRRLSDDESWEKRPGSVVTVADQAAEARLQRVLTDLVPGSLVVGEENRRATCSSARRTTPPR